MVVRGGGTLVDGYGKTKLGQRVDAVAHHVSPERECAVERLGRERNCVIPPVIDWATERHYAVISVQAPERELVGSDVGLVVGRAVCALEDVERHDVVLTVRCCAADDVATVGSVRAL